MLRIRIIILTLLTASCSSSTQKTANEQRNWTDTIYSSSVHDDPNFYRLTIQITDSTEQENPSFNLNEEEVIKIQVWEFDEYPIKIKNAKNVEVTSADSITGIFHLVPLDSNFSIEVWQNYGINHVFRKMKSEDGIKIKPENGEKLVGGWSWKIK